eukprot:GGOE01049330.1.p1 GENE.GGOE01049330.1~~GGOE01049330.1.p1  ORF type:complete len:356 (-),score=41.48 GGOE01049330.1:254-1270(-)
MLDLSPSPKQHSGHWKYHAATLGAVTIVALLSVAWHGTDLFQSISTTHRVKPLSSVPASSLPVSALQRPASSNLRNRATFNPPVEGRYHLSLPADLPTPAIHPRAPTLWVVAALISLVVNGVAGALLWAQWQSSQPRNFIMAAATGDAESSAEVTVEERVIDEQADSPKAKLEAQLEEVKAKLADVEKKYLYALAEIETVRRRGRQQVEDARKFGIEKFASSMLEVADNMARGLAWVPAEVAHGPCSEDNPNPDLRSLYGGMKSTEKIMLGVLEKHGIQKYEPLGEIYDPNLARAIAQVSVPNAEPGTVIKVVSAGFTLNGRVLRAADVVVVQEPQEE